jgi:hypothetical protein
VSHIVASRGLADAVERAVRRHLGLDPQHSADARLMLPSRSPEYPKRRLDSLHLANIGVLEPMSPERHAYRLGAGITCCPRLVGERPYSFDVRNRVRLGMG